MRMTYGEKKTLLAQGYPIHYNAVTRLNDWHLSPVTST